MKNSQKNTEIELESATEKLYGFPRFVAEELEREAKKKRDISLLKRASNILISVMEIPKILLSLSEGHSVIIDSSVHLFTGKVNTGKFRDLGLRVAGKKDQEFDINADVNSDISMLENQEILSKQYQNAAKAWKSSTHLFSEKSDSLADIFMMAWEFQEKNHPENVKISWEKSPMRHDYMLVKIAGLSFSAKFSVKTGKMLYIITADGKENPV